MPYIGNIPATQFAELKYQDFTGGTGTSFTLNDPVGSAQELEVFVNNVRQEPGVAYTVSGTTLTMTGSIVATDDFYVVFQGKSTGTATHPATQNLTAASGTFTNGLTVDDDGTTVLTVDRATSDGTIIDVQRGGSSLGAIGTTSSKMTVGGTVSGDSHLRFGQTGGVPTIQPADNSGALSDNTVSLGQSSYRFKDLYLGGNLYIGGTAAANALDDYEEGTFTPALNGEGACTITTSSATGYYTKVGRFVHVNMFFQLSAVSGGSSSLAVELANLPFNTNSAQNVAGSVRVANLGSSVEGVQVIVFNNSDGGRIEEFTGIGGTNLSDHLASNTNFQVTLGYST